MQNVPVDGLVFGNVSGYPQIFTLSKDFPYAQFVYCFFHLIEGAKTPIYDIVYLDKRDNQYYGLFGTYTDDIKISSYNTWCIGNKKQLKKMGCVEPKYRGVFREAIKLHFSLSKDKL